MTGNRFAGVAFLIFAMICVFVGPAQLLAQGRKTPYPTMAPLDRYLMPDRNAEIALARTAAPDSISRDATILVLGRHGYETAVKGNNGFVCAVERAWAGPIDDPGFWNPKTRSPICYNSQAARSILPITIKRAELVVAGKSREQIKAWTRVAYARKELPTTVAPGAMAYMMSKKAYLTDDDDHNLAHLMVFTPRMNKADWGADAPHSPVILFEQGPPEPFSVFIIPVGKWSDGSPAPLP